MSPTDAVLLSSFWSWVAGISAEVLLGLLLPLSAALLVALVPLAIRRRDWREPLEMLLPLTLFAGAGLFLLTRVQTHTPDSDFWAILSLQTGTLVFIAALPWLLAIARRRIRRDRAAISEASAVLDGDDAQRAIVGPGPRPRLRAIDAEYYVADWMRALGATEAIVTPARRDGGVDVRSRYYVAQVKHRPNDIVSVESVRALVGVAAIERRRPLFFASGRYSRECYGLAADAGAALFIFRPQDGRLVAANAIAQRLLDAGLRAAEGRVAQLAR